MTDQPDMLLCSREYARLDAQAVTFAELQAGEQTSASAPRRFSMVGYTGREMRFAALPHPVVVDLAGMRIGRANQPILKDHSTSMIVGHATMVRVQDGELRIEGVVSGAGAVANEIITSSLNGFPWQASIGASYDRSKLELVKAGKTVAVNGRIFNGPILVARETTLKEISFVALGADPDTSAAVAAHNDKEQVMKFSEWLKAKGFDEATLNNESKAFLQAQFDAELKAAEDKKDDPAPDPEGELSAAEQVALRLAGYDEIFADAQHAKLKAQAIREKWSLDKCRLEAMRAERPKSPGPNPNRDPHEAGVLECAVALSHGMTGEELEAQGVDEKTIDAATAGRYRRFGLQALCRAIIQAAGGAPSTNGFGAEDIRETFRASASLQASTTGFSTISLPGILSNVANKRLLQAYQSVEAVGERICSVRPVNDFKSTTAYRLTSGGVWEKVAPTGELKNGKLAEASYANRAETYGQVLTITRQMFINDDLGAFLQLAQQMGRLAIITRERVVFSVLLSNAGNFFHTDNKNTLSGGTSALSIDSLTAAEKLFLEQVDSNNNPVMVSPQLLLVPPALKVTAEKLFNDTWVNETTTANAAKPAGNPHARRFTPLCSPFISLTGITNSSATRWYLMANPADLAAIELVYLNGKNTPTIETGEVDFNQLGLAMRGYHDFGVAYQDPRAAVMSAGA